MVGEVVVGMTVGQVVAVLGFPVERLSGGAFLGDMGAVLGGRRGLEWLVGLEFWLYRVGDVATKVTFRAGVVEDVEQEPWV